MKRATLILGLAVLLCGATGAQATPIKITYTITATATGTLGTQPFTDALVTIEFVGDPSKAHLGAPAAHLWVNSGTGTVTIAGVGTATFTPGPVAFDDQGGVPHSCSHHPCYAGISFGTGGSTILGDIHTDFLTYNLKTATGPVSGTAVINPTFTAGTSLGGLTFSSVGATSTFTATTGTTTIPEPGSLIFVSTGLLSLIGFVRRRLS